MEMLNWSAENKGKKEALWIGNTRKERHGLLKVQLSQLNRIP